MTYFKSRTIPATLFITAALALSGCGGSSSSNDSPGGGNPPPQAVNQDPVTIQGQGDAEASALAARKAAMQAIVEDRTPSLGGGAPGGIDMMPVAAQSNIPGDCGGSASVTPLGEATEDGFRSTFNNFCVQDDDGTETVVDGYIESRSSGTNFFVDANYTVTTGGETYRINRACSANGCFNQFASDGNSYRIYSADVTGPDANGAYDTEARVCTNDEGCITFEATGLIECPAPTGGFSDGTIRITDSTGTDVVRVEFNGCGTYTVTFDGVGYLVNY